jgi:hypothetical protein
MLHDMASRIAKKLACISEEAERASARANASAGHSEGACSAAHSQIAKLS